MNWKAKTPPKLGDKKEKVWFALFPTKVEDKWIWLEKYILIKEYKTYYYEHNVVVSEGILTEKYYTETRETEGWIRIDRRLITK